MDLLEDRNYLISVVSAVHNGLRKAYKDSGDFQCVWEDHVSEIESRKKYASAMLSLATTKWNIDSRIEWCHETAMAFFHHGGMQHSLNQERKSLIRILKKANMPIPSNIDKEDIVQFTTEKLKLLDVGSCYNPFSKFEEFTTVAIDLTPATEDVYQCDFTKVEVSRSFSLTNLLKNPIKQLPAESFDIVVFSLLLSYLPASEKRLEFCEKARNLLKENGLLLIITPDSKHVNKNAAMIKSWKFALENLGFRRFRYEKLKHLHCMAFHKMKFKCLVPKVDVNLSKMMYIPQDFKEYYDPIPVLPRTQNEEEEVIKTFFELPFGDDF